MKVYILKDEDFEKLLAEIDRDPAHGRNGGSSQVISQQEREAFLEAHRFYNYIIRKWLDDVKK